MLPLAVAGCVIVSIFLFSGPSEMPLMISRSLSIVLPVSPERVDEFAREFSASDERGWASPFRAELNRLAWYEISHNPLFGKGFVLSRDEIVWSFSRPRSFEEATKKLAVTGMYHDSLVELAVFCGIPAVVFFVISFFRVAIRFFHLVPDIADKKLKVLSSGLLGFFVATSGQMLMNGGGRDFFYMCVLLGVLRGIYVRCTSEKGTGNDGVPDSDASMIRA